MQWWISRSDPTSVAQYRNVGERTIARLPRVAQIAIDRTSTTNRLSNARDLILATNSAVSEEREPYYYIGEEELRRMFEGKKITIIPYSGRNHPHKEHHNPKTGKDFDDAVANAISLIEHTHPVDYIPLHRQKDKSLAVARAEAFYVTGGNSSGHSANLFGYRNFDSSPIENVAGANTEPLQYLLRRKIANGTPYFGVSAGQMIAMANIIPHIDPPAHIHLRRTFLGEVRISIPFDGLNLLGNFGLAVQPHYDPGKQTNYYWGVA